MKLLEYFKKLKNSCKKNNIPKKTKLEDMNEVIKNLFQLEFTKKSDYYEFLRCINENGEMERVCSIKTKDLYSMEAAEELIKNILKYGNQKSIKLVVTHEISNYWPNYFKIPLNKNSISSKSIEINSFETISTKFESNYIFNRKLKVSDIEKIFPIEYYNTNGNLFYNFVLTQNLSIRDEIKNLLGRPAVKKSLEDLFSNNEKNYKSSRFYKKAKKIIQITRNNYHVMEMKDKFSYLNKKNYYTCSPVIAYKNLVLLFEVELFLEKLLLKTSSALEIAKHDPQLLSRCPSVFQMENFHDIIAESEVLVKKAIFIFKKTNKEKELIFKLLKENPQIYFYLEETYQKDNSICLELIKQDPEKIDFIFSKGPLTKNEWANLFIEKIEK